MSVLGYKTGELNVEAAMTSDIVVRPDMNLQALADAIEMSRPIMDIHKGMERKYTPFNFDLVNAGPISGGRYVFDTWENAQRYYRWTHDEFEVEPGQKFWEWSNFLSVDKHIWRVVGAHDFIPIELHGVNRFERWQYTADTVRTELLEIWPALRERARKSGLGSVWLLDQPEEKQIAILTTDSANPGGNTLLSAQATITRASARDSLGQMLHNIVGLTKLFDRTNLVISTWVPVSRDLGGDHVAHPMKPVLPVPSFLK